MDLRHLRYFVVVAEEQHFTRAAQRLHMAQPPLSQAIRQLESELGVQLLRRSTRRVALTEAGAAYLESARAILGDVDDAAVHARQVAAGVIGRLALACVGSATYSLLPQLSRGLAADLPGIEFAFRGEMLVPDQLTALREGTIDIALLRPPVADLGVAVETVRRDRLVVAIPDGHRLAKASRIRCEQLAGTDLIVHSARRSSVMYDVVIGLLHDAGVDTHIRHEVGETSTLITLVAGGLGVAVVPEPVSALRLAGVVYRPLVRPAASVELAVARRAVREEPHLLQAIEVIKRIVGASC